MNCFYCNQSCRLAGTLKIPNTEKQLINYWQCDNCPHRILFDQWHQSKDVSIVKMYVMISKTEYCYEHIFKWDTSNVASIYSTFYDEGGHQYLSKSPIISFSPAPKITPQNVKEKMKLYLTFL